jgi:hypothetical protein
MALETFVRTHSISVVGLNGFAEVVAACSGSRL